LTSGELAAELHSLARPAGAPRPVRTHCCRRSGALLCEPGCLARCLTSRRLNASGCALF